MPLREADTRGALSVAVLLLAIGFLAWIIVPRLAGSNDGAELLATDAGPATTQQLPTTSAPTTSSSSIASSGSSTSSVGLEAAPTPTTFPAVLDAAITDVSDRGDLVTLSMDVIETIPHDPAAFTQGLEFVGERLFESTGLVGQSTLREVDPATGTVIRSTPPPGDVFAEGVTEVDGELLQLTWRAEVAYRWDLETFELVNTHRYDGEGWGICDDGDRLVMSNGTSELTFRDRASFAETGRISVTYRGALLDQLNELECVGGLVWANVWKTDLIVVIDPSDGAVVSVLNAGALRPESTLDDSGAVLNGIAWDAPTDTFLLSGKRWPVTYRVRLVPN